MLSVYILTNTVSGRQYVGFTSGTVARRIGKHVSDARKGAGWALHAAIRKHTINAFTVETYAVVPDRPAAAALEQELIVRIGSRAPQGYNLTDGGDGARGYRHTDAWKEHLRQSRLGKKRPAEVVERMRRSLTGRKMSDAACVAMARAQRGRRHTPETIAKMQESARARWQRWRAVRAREAT